MSPEQCAATKELGPPSDQYSLGVVAYEMLSGRLPFAQESVMAIMYAHFNEPPAPIQTARADCPPAIASAVMRMLEKEPEKRWPTVEAAVAAFGAAPMAPDDPVRTQMMTLATKGGTSQLLAGLSTPQSPTPAGRSQTARTGKTTGVVGLVLSPDDVTVAVGGAVQLTARPKRASGATLFGRTITWASTDTDVATVSHSGLVTAIKPGFATLTCTCEGASATAAVTVTGHRKSRALAYVGSAVVVGGLAAAAWFLGPWRGKTAAPPPANQQPQSVVVVPPPPPPDTTTSAANRPSRPSDRPSREDRRAALAALHSDSAVRELRANARAARERAVTAGATSTDLAPGDAERRAAEQVVGRDRVVDVMAHLSAAIGLWA